MSSSHVYEASSSLPAWKYPVRRVRSAKQARSLQRCSTQDCVVCGAEARLSCEAQVDAWITNPHTQTTERQHAPGIEGRRFWPICRKDKAFRGVVILDKGYGQYRRARVIA